MLNFDLLMFIPWMYLTIYNETIKEIGTKFVNNNIQLPHFINILWNRLKYYQFNIIFRSILPAEYTDNNALNNVIAIWIKNITATIIPILNYNLDFFWRVLLLFNIILVSTPVYTTQPVIQSVILRLHPRRIILLLSKGTLFHDPVKVWINGFGL